MSVGSVSEWPCERTKGATHNHLAEDCCAFEGTEGLAPDLGEAYQESFQVKTRLHRCEG